MKPTPSVILIATLGIFCAACSNGETSAEQAPDTVVETSDDLAPDIADDPAADRDDTSQPSGVFEDPRFITDDQGRVLILHGMNFMGSAKSPPFLPTVDYEVADVMPLDWGFNHVRYLIIWEGVEPEPGVYDEDYLDQVEEWLDYFHSLDMLVYLDMHQDLWARIYGGDGAPDWAIRHDDQPFTGQSMWFMNYFQPAVQRCFDNFWAYDDGDHADLQDHYAAMWAHVADRFNDHPAVIGYDLMNEPHPGTDMDVTELLGDANPSGTHPSFDRDKFHPFYQRVISAIRAVDPDTRIFFEPRYGAPGNGTPSYLPVIEDPRDGPARIVYAPHLYSVQTEGAEHYDPDSDHVITDWERERTAELETQAMPLIIGEWGLGASWVNADLFSFDVLEMADRMLAGWSYWVFDNGSWSFLEGPWDDLQESENANWVVRVYPRRIAGVPTMFAYDRVERTFRLEFEDRDGITGPTEIYIPAARFFPDGWELTVSDEDDTWSSEWDAEHELLFVTTPATDDTHIIEVRPTGE